MILKNKKFVNEKSEILNAGFYLQQKSKSSVHGSSDSRYQKDSGEDDGNDHGIGSGTIYLYEDATVGSSTRGQLVGWTWSTASSYTYQFTQAGAVDNNGKTTYRPMVIGRFSGAGL